MRLLMLLGVIVLCGCSGIQNAGSRVIRQEGYRSSIFQSHVFRHLVLYNNRSSEHRLHIYIDGDGTPWVRGTHPAKDPTPRNPLVFRLMAQDRHEAVYVGRPCYYSMGPESHCSADLWTSARYSEQVIDSMANVITELASQSDAAETVLIGYSGGAVIATLLALRIQSIDALVTVAGNLDTDLWTERLGLLPLTESRNPARVDEYRSDLTQLHFSGGADRRVPTAITASFTDKQGVDLIVYPDFDHTCCWEKNWRQILELLDDAVQSRTGP